MNGKTGNNTAGGVFSSHTEHTANHSLTVTSVSIYILLWMMKYV